MRISGAESVVMDVLWRKSPRTAEEIMAEVGAEQSWTEATVKTLLNRLLKKNALAADRDGRRFLYRPLLDRRDYVQSESQGLLDRLFDGRLAPLVSHFSQQAKLSDEDIAELRRVVEALDHDR